MVASGALQLSAPKTTPTRVAIKMQGTRPVGDVRTATTAARAAIEPTERSNSPAMIVTASPSAARPTSGKPSSTAKMLPTPRKLGVIPAMTAQVTRSTTRGSA